MLSFHWLIKGFLFCQFLVFSAFPPSQGYLSLGIRIAWYFLRANTTLERKSPLEIVYDVTDVIPNYSGYFFHPTIK